MFTSTVYPALLAGGADLAVRCAEDALIGDADGFAGSGQDAEVDRFRDEAGGGEVPEHFEPEAVFDAGLYGGGAG
ncbi:hypothetical protein ACIO3R_33955 [Streptomyces sp. NPDC087428]|uniref:hypothetical protein n=1 Tax=Streptomyces sp. NPDC087428 TaxID=3365788 RepID=UPI003822819D